MVWKFERQTKMQPVPPGAGLNALRILMDYIALALNIWWLTELVLGETLEGEPLERWWMYVVILVALLNFSHGTHFVLTLRRLAKNANLKLSSLLIVPEFWMYATGTIGTWLLAPFLIGFSAYRLWL